MKDDRYVISAEWIFLDGEFRKGMALLVNGDRIDGVLERDDALFLGKYLPFTEYSGEFMLLPAFIDAHSHLYAYGIDRNRPSLEGFSSLKDVLEFVKHFVSERERNLYIFVDFDQSGWKEGRMPRREELDLVAPDRPVILRRVCGHVAVGNRKALELLPEGIDGVDWETGLMVEDVPLNLNRYFPPDDGEIEEGILRGQKEYMGLGVASVHEFGTPRTFGIYQKLERERKLKLRVYHSFYREFLRAIAEAGLRTGFGSLFLKVGGIKAFADGSVGARTAAFFEPYKGESTSGVLFLSSDEIESLVRNAEGAGLQVIIHAIGDRAIEQVIEGYRRAISPGNPLRHRMEHFEFPLDRSVDGASELGLYLSVQPNFVARWGMKGGMYEDFLGRTRWSRNNPFRALCDSGLKVAFGSDSMPPSPLLGLEGAVNHPIESQRLDMERALSLYTEAGAFFSFEENLKGRLCEGYLADLLILRGKPDSKPGDLKVVDLYIGGKKMEGEGIGKA